MDCGQSEWLIICGRGSNSLAKINSNGQWVDRTEQVNLNDLFDKMSAEELERYAQN
jgi:hypothetical protein